MNLQRLALSALVLCFVLPAPAMAVDLPNWPAIERMTRMKGKLNEKEGVFKVQLPRVDLYAKVAGVRVVPPMGLTCWAAFRKSGDTAMVMGDLVLLEDQVDQVMDAALHNGLDVTALHNHFAFDTPRIMFMHISGMGREEALAEAVGRVFTVIRQTTGGKGKKPTRLQVEPGKPVLTVPKLEAILGKGEYADGVFKVTFGRTTRMHGHEVGKEMGVNTWAAFAGSDQQAVVDGDFAVLESELQGVIRALRQAGISVVAIHNHMTGEAPRIMFLHFWGVGRPDALAQGIRGALAKTAAGGDGETGGAAKRSMPGPS